MEPTHCNTLQLTAIHYNSLQLIATYCSTLPHTATARVTQIWGLHPATHCNTLQHTATHCIMLQLTATHCNSLQQRVVPGYGGGMSSAKAQLESDTKVWLVKCGSVCCSMCCSECCSVVAVWRRLRRNLNLSPQCVVPSGTACVAACVAVAVCVAASVVACVAVWRRHVVG